MDEIRPQVVIYTDGACFGNPGPGGWAVIVSSGNHEKILQGHEKETTNNRMELTAAIQGLKALTKACAVNIFTDSEYLRRGITEWMPNWKARNWRRKEGPLANADLWQALDSAQVRHSINWHWLRGHAGDPKNERVDRLAKEAIGQKS